MGAVGWAMKKGDWVLMATGKVMHRIVQVDVQGYAMHSLGCRYAVPVRYLREVPPGFVGAQCSKCLKFSVKVG